MRDRWGREGGREREAGTTWLPHRSTVSRLPRGLSAFSTSAAGLFFGKKKFRLLSGYFYMRKEKLRLRF